MGSESLDSMVMCTKAEKGQQQQQQQQVEKKARAADEQALKCPRCDSSNTKFCYYNNYSLSQPRYFCKSCRRYWTKGGTLRNVPVGGGCRKNRRSSSSKRNTTPPPDHHLHLQCSPSFSPSSLINSYDHNGNISILGNHGNSHFGNPSANNNNNSFLEALRSGLIDNNNNNHLLYYGMNDVDDICMHQEIMSNASSGSSTPTTTSVKQEWGENRMLWGFPWQLNANGGNTENEMDSLRETWNNAFVASSWNTNLLYTPLI